MLTSNGIGTGMGIGMGCGNAGMGGPGMGGGIEAMMGGPGKGGGNAVMGGPGMGGGIDAVMDGPGMGDAVMSGPGMTDAEMGGIGGVGGVIIEMGGIGLLDSLLRIASGQILVGKISGEVLVGIGDVLVDRISGEALVGIASGEVRVDRIPSEVLVRIASGEVFDGTSSMRGLSRALGCERSSDPKTRVKAFCKSPISLTISETSVLGCDGGGGSQGNRVRRGGRGDGVGSCNDLRRGSIGSCQGNDILRWRSSGCFSRSDMTTPPSIQHSLFMWCFASASAAFCRWLPPHSRMVAPRTASEDQPCSPACWPRILGPVSLGRICGVLSLAETFKTLTQAM
jgi:hypothetical protein